jgi:hypothetical protein
MVLFEFFIVLFSLHDLEDLLEVLFFLWSQFFCGLELIGQHISLHKVNEPKTVSIRRHSRDERAILVGALELVFTVLAKIEVLQVVNDAKVVQIHAIFTHGNVSRLRVGEIVFHFEFPGIFFLGFHLIFF